MLCSLDQSKFVLLATFGSIYPAAVEVMSQYEVSNVAFMNGCHSFCFSHLSG